MKAHPELAVYSFCIVLSIAFFNALGVGITKYSTASQRSTVDTSRTLIIWAVSVAVGWENFLPLELVGFALLVLGTLVYNEIIIVPIGFMNKWTKREITKRKKTEGGLLDEVAGSMVEAGKNPDYMATSPTGGSSSRNMRALAKAGEKENVRRSLV